MFRHTFCSTCIYQACDASPVCPIDRSPVSTNDIQPAVKIISNMVNELLVECPRSEEGCTHVGQRQYIENHVKNDCQYTFTSCDLEECKALVLKKDLTTHVSTCKYRPAECKMCKRKMRAIELEVKGYDNMVDKLGYSFNMIGSSSTMSSRDYPMSPL